MARDVAFKNVVKLSQSASTETEVDIEASGSPIREGVPKGRDLAKSKVDEAFENVGKQIRLNWIQRRLNSRLSWRET